MGHWRLKRLSSPAILKVKYPKVVMGPPALTTVLSDTIEPEFSLSILGHLLAQPLQEVFQVSRYKVSGNFSTRILH